MMIIVNSLLDIESSKEFNTQYQDLIKQNRCYRNIYNLIHNNRDIDSFLVAFGYCGVPAVNMVRHCYLLTKDKTIVVDPSLIDRQEIYSYHTFKTYSIDEYREIIIERQLQVDYSCNGFDISFGSVLSEEENKYCLFAIQNKVHIDSYSYENYLATYDSQKKVIVCYKK